MSHSGSLGIKTQTHLSRDYSLSIRDELEGKYHLTKGIRHSPLMYHINPKPFVRFPVFRKLLVYVKNHSLS